MKDSQTQMAGRSQAVAGLWKARKARDAKVLAIAQQCLDLETLERRHMDGLDFSEQSVSGLKEALEAAFAAGEEAAARRAVGATPIETRAEVVRATPTARKLAVTTKAEAFTLADLADAARDVYSGETAPESVLYGLDDIRFAARQAAERAHFKPFAVGTDGLAFATLRSAANSILADWMDGDSDAPANSKESKDALRTIAAVLDGDGEGRREVVAG